MSDDQNRRTILCIDDDYEVLVYHKALLERRGYEVITATSGRQALQIAEIFPVAAVIVDYNMPEMNGHEVVVEIKRLGHKSPL